MYRWFYFCVTQAWAIVNLRKKQAKVEWNGMKFLSLETDSKLAFNNREPLVEIFESVQKLVRATSLGKAFIGITGTIMYEYRVARIIT